MLNGGDAGTIFETGYAVAKGIPYPKCIKAEPKSAAVARFPHRRTTGGWMLPRSGRVAVKRQLWPVRSALSKFDHMAHSELAEPSGMYACR